MTQPQPHDLAMRMAGPREALEAMMNDVSVVLVAFVAIFLSNFPEGLSSAAGMKKAGRPASYVFGLWGGIVLVSGLSEVGLGRGWVDRNVNRFQFQKELQAVRGDGPDPAVVGVDVGTPSAVFQTAAASATS